MTGKRRAPSPMNPLVLDSVYQQMQWLEEQTGYLPFVGLALELSDKGIAFPAVVGRLERIQRDGTREVVHKVSQKYPNVSYRTLEAVCIHLLYELENLVQKA